MWSTQARDEDGFTLIELLMAVTLSVLLLGGIGTAFVSAMNGSQGVHERMLQSHDAQTLAIYFTSDVQSADPSLVLAGPTMPDGVTPVSTGCDGASPGKNVLRLQWTEDDGTASRTAFSVSYRFPDPAPTTGPATLTRYFCTDIGLPIAGVLPEASTILSDKQATTHRVASRLGSPAPEATILGPKITLLLNSFEDEDSDAFAFSLSASMRTPTANPYVSSISRNGDATTNATSVSWTVTFSESVTGVAESHFSLVTALGGAITDFDGSGTTYTVTAGTGSGDGTLALKLTDDDLIIDADSNPLGGPGANNSTDGFFTIDKTDPTVSVEQKSGDPTTSLPALFTVTFSESVSGFDLSDVTKSGTSSGGTVGVTGSGTTYEVSVTNVTTTGTIVVSVGADRATDAADNGNSASTSVDNSVQYTLPPMVSSINRVGTTPTHASTLAWTVVFDQAVTGVTDDDFEVVETGAATGNVTNVSGSGTTWTVTVTRGSGASGTLGLNLDDDDSIKNGTIPLASSTSPDGSFTGETYTVKVSITSVELKNKSGGVAGQMEKGDQIVVRFAQAMDASTLCSAWASGASTATMNSNNTRVFVTNGGAASDSLTVTANGCTVNFGSIDLGGTGYVNATMNFGTNGSGNPASMTWDSSDRRLTITLGTASSSSVGSAVASSSPSYTPVAAMKDSSGAAISTAPFGLTSGQQF